MNITTTEGNKTLEHIAKSFVESGIYESTDKFVADLLKDLAKRKIKTYKKKIKTYETKYGSFEKFTQKIGGTATPKQENQWMDWEAAISMPKACSRVTCELDSSVS